MSGLGAGCPGWGPDVRAGGANFCSLWIGGVGCPGERPDFRGFRRSRMSGAWGRMSGPCSASLGGLLLL